jgi:hypothetical protein
MVLTSSFTSFTTTPSFRQFLYLLKEAIYFHQHIAFYYDLSHVSKVERDILHKMLATKYEKFYNITFFSDFVPGFLTNSDGVSLISKKPNFSFIVFLNYNPKSAHQNSLLNEIITFKYEYILISPYQVDLVAFVPFLFLDLDLNDYLVLNLVNFYIFKYISLFVNVSKHNVDGDLMLNTLYNYNCFYIIVLIRHKKMLNYHLKKFVKYKKMINTVSKLIFILLKSTKYKQKFLNKFYTPSHIQLLSTEHVMLKKVFLKEIHNLFLKLHNSLKPKKVLKQKKMKKSKKV